MNSNYFAIKIYRQNNEIIKYFSITIQNDTKHTHIHDKTYTHMHKRKRNLVSYQKKMKYLECMY